MFNFFKPKFNIRTKRLENSLTIVANINGKKISSMKCVVEEKAILIGDIEPFRNHKDFNKGYGTMMMNCYHMPNKIILTKYMDIYQMLILIIKKDYYIFILSLVLK